MSYENMHLELCENNITIAEQEKMEVTETQPLLHRSTDLESGYSSCSDTPPKTPDNSATDTEYFSEDDWVRQHPKLRKKKSKKKQSYVDQRKQLEKLQESYEALLQQNNLKDEQLEILKMNKGSLLQKCQSKDDNIEFLENIIAKNKAIIFHVDAQLKEQIEETNKCKNEVAEARKTFYEAIPLIVKEVSTTVEKWVTEKWKEDQQNQSRRNHEESSQPTWQDQFSKIRNKLTSREENYVSNSLDTFENRISLIQKYHSGIMTKAQHDKIIKNNYSYNKTKFSKTQKYIEHLKREFKEQYLQYEEEKAEISSEYQQFQYNFAMLECEFKDLKVTLKKKDKELQESFLNQNEINEDRKQLQQKLLHYEKLEKELTTLRSQLREGGGNLDKNFKNSDKVNETNVFYPEKQDGQLSENTVKRKKNNQKKKWQNEYYAPYVHWTH